MNQVAQTPFVIVLVLLLVLVLVLVIVIVIDRLLRLRAT